MKKPLVILTGPTAVGKTGLSIKLAKMIDAEIISADSMQVYKKMDIGSAKIKEEEMAGIRHYLIDEYEFDHPFNVAEFQSKAKLAAKEIYSHGKIPLIVGGTGFYIQAVLKEVDFTKTEADKPTRESLLMLAKEKGNGSVHEMLKAVDPEAANEIHPNNIKRVIRALEFYEETGMKISEHNEAERSKSSPYNFAYFVLTKPRQKLYEAIDLRVDKMMEAGLLDEVRVLKDLGATPDMVSMQGLGYKELLSYLNGEITLERAIELIKLGTRHFAKRQLTWFKREDEVCYLEAEDKNDDELLLEIQSVLKEKNII